MLPVIICLIAFAGTNLSAQNAVLISEIATITNGQYIELYNASESSVNIENYKISYYSGVGVTYTFPAGKTIVPKSVFALVLTSNQSAVLTSYPQLNGASNVVFSITTTRASEY